MKFTNTIFAKLLRESLLTSKRDRYSRLVEFEKLVVNYLTKKTHRKLKKEDLLEGHRLLKIINDAQIQLLEESLQEDLDGDGKIAGKSK